MEKVFEDVKLVDMPIVAKELIELASTWNIWTFQGNLGAGKTTLIKELCQQIGVQQAVQSPTFSIVNTYVLENEEELYHFDCYRLKKEEEAFDFGLEEYLYSGSRCLIEWPQIIEKQLPKPHLSITIESTKFSSRTIKIKTIE